MNSFQEGTDGTKYMQKKSLAFQSDKISLSSSSSSEYKNTRSCVGQDLINPDDSKDLPSCSSNKTSSRIKECIQQSISAESKKTISSILNEVNQLSDLEKLLLYLQLPTGAPANVDPLKQKSPGNPLGKKADIAVAQTYTWIQSHLEEDPEVSLPKQEIYEEYKLFCDANKIEGLCAADFGKVMKYVFPSVKPRRLGTRGNSRYCYSGLRKKLSVETPALPDITIELESLQEGKNTIVNDELSSAASYLIYEWAEKLLNKKFESLSDLASHLVENLYVDTRSVAAFTVLSSSNNQPVGKSSQGNLLLKSSTNKRRETQLHLQRKLQEKELIREQKKKLQQLSKNYKSSNGCRKSSKKESGARSKEGAANTSDAKPDVSVDKVNSSIVDQVVKKEEKDKAAANSSTCRTLSPIKPIRSYSEGSIALEQESNNRPKKIPINRKTSSPGACFSQTVPSIILLSSLPQVDIDVKNCSPVQKPSSQKYKRIQPKPSQYPTTSIAIPSQSLLNIENGVEKPICGYSLELAEANGLAALQDTNGKTPTPKLPETTDKSNVEILKTISAALASTTQTRNVFQSDSTIHRKSLAFGPSQNESLTVVKKGKKTPSLAKEPKLKISNGKRCLEDSKSSRPFKKPLIELASQQNSENFSSKNESQNISMKRLTKDQIDASLINKNLTIDNLDRVSIDEVSIQQIETDALMEEYLHGNQEEMSEKNTNKSSFDKMGDIKIELEGTKQILPTSKAQLSQLRLLLQRNLPQPSLSRSVVAKPTTAVSEENSILDGFTGFVTGLTDLRSNGNRHSSFRSQSEPSSFFFNFNGHGVDDIEPSLQLGESILREQPKLENEMEESQALQDSKLFNSNLEFHNSEFNMCGDTALSDDQALTLPTITTKSESGLEFGLNRSFDDINNDVSSLDKSNLLSYSSSFTQMSSVPPSPNTRRRAFNFMPISPRQTPVPENLGFANAGGSSVVSSSPLQMFVPGNNGTSISASVGPSQPPSTASSPFVSPRGTPVPISRSRHNSGQSAYSTPRQTPSQNFVDSGVSSISTSPFVSPQTTPVPVSRLRHNSNHGGTGKTVTFSTAVAQGGMQNGLSFQCRSRHNSGPLPPPPSLAASCSTTSSGGIISYFMSPRSAPLSPLVGENFTQTNFNFPSTSVEGNGKVRSRHSSASSLNIPMSPLSSPVSPSSHLIGNSDPLVGASDTSNKSNGLSKKFGFEEGRNAWNVTNRLPSMSSLKNSSQFSWPSISEGQFCPPSSASTLRKRNRHVSGSVIHHRPSNHDPFVQELQSFLQSDSPSSPNPIADSISRSRSVPLQQMLLLEQLNHSISSSGTIDASGNFNFNNSSNKDLFDRSYQSTPIQDTFQLVADQGNPNEENLTSSPFVGNSGNFSEENSRKEQDLGVSQSSGLSSWANNLENLASRRNINELLEGDILQSTLEDLRDFDNDFSKFAEELEQMDQSKEPDF